MGIGIKTIGTPYLHHPYAASLSDLLRAVIGFLVWLAVLSFVATQSDTVNNRLSLSPENPGVKSPGFSIDC